MDLRLNLSSSFQPLLNVTSRYLILCGGAGSGKSKFAARKVVFRCATEGGHKFLITRKVARSIRESCMAEIEEVLDQNKIRYALNKTDRIIAFRNNRLIFMGLDDVEKIKSIEGITGTWEEEATENTEGDFMQIDLRLRGETKRYKQRILTFNPVESDASWLKERFFDPAKPPENATVHRSTIDDNPFIDAEYRAVLDGLDDPTYSSIYRRGEWAVAKGVIYSNWTVAGDQWPESFQEEVWGLDFGFNNPMALVKVGILDDDLYLRQYVYASKMTTADLIKRLIEMKAAGDIRSSSPIYADSAEPDRIVEIYRAGFNVQAAKKDVNDGIDRVKRHKLVVHPDSLDVIAELKVYKWKVDRNGRTLDEPVKFMDHACDAVRYAAYTHFGKPKIIPRFASL